MVSQEEELLENDHDEDSNENGNVINASDFIKTDTTLND